MFERERIAHFLDENREKKNRKIESFRFSKTLEI